MVETFTKPVVDACWSRNCLIMQPQLSSYAASMISSIGQGSVFSVIQAGAMLQHGPCSIIRRSTGPGLPFAAIMIAVTISLTE